jgi:hypothetical protein
LYRLRSLEQVVRHTSRRRPEEQPRAVDVIRAMREEIEAKGFPPDVAGAVLSALENVAAVLARGEDVVDGRWEFFDDTDALTRVHPPAGVLSTIDEHTLTELVRDTERAFGRFTGATTALSLTEEVWEFQIADALELARGEFRLSPCGQTELYSRLEPDERRPWEDEGA